MTLFYSFHKNYGTSASNIVREAQCKNVFSKCCDSSLTSPCVAGACTGFPGPGVEKHIAVNPYRELINPELGDRYHQMFNEFKTKHGKEYTDDVEHAKRKFHFVQNVR